MFKIIKDSYEFLKMAKELYKTGAIGDIEEWHMYFDTHEINLEEGDDGYSEELTDPKDYIGQMGNRPDSEEYPVVVYYQFEVSWDRFGESVLTIMDWESLDKLKGDE